MKQVWVLGAGGHAKVVIDALRASGGCEVVGALDDDPGRRGGSVLGVPVEGAITVESVERLLVEHAIIAVGSNRTRAEIVGRFEGRVRWATAVHPRAHLAPGVEPGPGSVVLAGAIVQVDAVIGGHVIVNTSSSVDHDGVLEDFAHVAPGAHLAGEVRIGRGVLLGIGSVVAPGRSVGAWSTVAAGGVVVRDIPPGVVAVGTPARPRPMGVGGVATRRSPS